jgi:hypothetical protein
VGEISKSADVFFYYDPVATLEPHELQYVNEVVAEKLKMILEKNPAVSVGVDLGQVKRLRDLSENSEVEKVRSALASQLQEAETLRKEKHLLQRELAEAAASARKRGSAAADAVAKHLEAQLSESREQNHMTQAQLREAMDFSKKLAQEKEGLQGTLRDTQCALAASEEENCSHRRTIEEVQREELLQRSRANTLDNEQRRCTRALAELTDANKSLQDSLRRVHGRFCSKNVQEVEHDELGQRRRSNTLEDGQQKNPQTLAELADAKYSRQDFPYVHGRSSSRSSEARAADRPSSTGAFDSFIADIAEAEATTQGDAGVEDNRVTDVSRLDTESQHLREALRAPLARTVAPRGVEAVHNPDDDLKGSTQLCCHDVSTKLHHPVDVSDESFCSISTVLPLDTYAVQAVEFLTNVRAEPQASNAEYTLSSGSESVGVITCSSSSAELSAFEATASTQLPEYLDDIDDEQVLATTTARKQMDALSSALAELNPHDLTQLNEVMGVTGKSSATSVATPAPIVESAATVAQAKDAAVNVQRSLDTLCTLTARIATSLRDVVSESHRSRQTGAIAQNAVREVADQLVACPLIEDNPQLQSCLSQLRQVQSVTEFAVSRQCMGSAQRCYNNPRPRSQLGHGRGGSTSRHTSAHPARRASGATDVDMAVVGMRLSGEFSPPLPACIADAGMSETWPASHVAFHAHALPPLAGKQHAQVGCTASRVTESQECRRQLGRPATAQNAPMRSSSRTPPHAEPLAIRSYSVSPSPPQLHTSSPMPASPADSQGQASVEASAEISQVRTPEEPRHGFPHRTNRIHSRVLSRPKAESLSECVIDVSMPIIPSRPPGRCSFQRVPANHQPMRSRTDSQGGNDACV